MICENPIGPETAGERLETDRGMFNGLWLLDPHIFCPNTLTTLTIITIRLIDYRHMELRIITLSLTFL